MKPILTIIFLLTIGIHSFAQVTDPVLKERHIKQSDNNNKRGLADPFVGITTNGEIQENLYEITSTGISTEPVRLAAINFLKSLDKSQQEKTKFDIDDDEWRKWMNQHFYVRQGVGFHEMNEVQRTAAFNLMSASLSSKGLKLSKDIMKLNHTLGEIQNDFKQYGEFLYNITIMGKPSETEPWGWQIDGHHLIINYFVLGDQVVMTPLFVGSEPVIAETGKYKGISILQEEQHMGLKMFNSLNKQQKNKATIQLLKEGNNNMTEAFKDNVVLDYKGIKASSFNKEQKKQMVKLIELFVNNMDDGHAKVKMEEVTKHLNKTWFAWIGESKDNSVYYYRIHSPVILIEFDNQKPVGTRKLYGNKPHRQHVHVVVRTPNGNDYGKDLLKQHYKKHAH